MITYQNFCRLLISVCARFRSDDEGRVNTFATIKQRSDQNESTYGNTFEDYQDGYYWDREWIKSGAAPNTIKGSKNALTIEVKRQDLISLTDYNYTSRLYISMASVLSVEQFGKKLTRERLAYLNARNIMAMYHALKVSAEYAIDWNGEQYSQYLTPSQAIYIRSDGGQAIHGPSDIIHKLVGPISEIKWAHQDVAASAVEMTLEVCEDLPSLTDKIDPTIQKSIVAFQNKRS